MAEDDSQLRALADSLPHLVWTARPDGSHDYLNRGWCEFTGLGGDRPGDAWEQALHPDDRALARERWQQALASGRFDDVECRIRAADGSYGWFLVRARPILSPGGAVARWLGTCTDITRHKQVEEQHRLALEAAELGTWDYDVGTGLVRQDERTCVLVGVAADGPRTVPLAEMLARVHDEDRPQAEERMRAALDPRSDGRYDAEYRVLEADGSARWLHARGRTAFAGDGAERRAVRLSGVVSDTTRRRASEEAQTLLTRELNHRVKNLFAIASGMVSMTARSARTPQDMAEALRGRLGALSRAHELVRPAVVGAGPYAQATTIDRLAAAILSPYAPTANENRLILEGPPVPVGSQTTTSLALVLHELAINAAKYGCLSSPDGRLAVRWAAGSAAVDLTWTETGGPPVAQAPDHEGFGGQLARKSVTGQLGGTLDQDWRRDGLVVRMTLPLDRLSH